MSAPAAAADRIVDWHATIRIGADGLLTVTERLALEVEGGELAHGLRREIPLEHRDRFGGQVSVPLELISVTHNGAAEPASVAASLNEGAVVTPPLARGTHTYELTYRTARQVGHFADHDELYWTLRGESWHVPVDHISAEVLLPKPVPASAIRAEAYTGASGARGRDYVQMIRDGAVGFTSTMAFKPDEGMAIVVDFPKGIVEPPGFWRRLGWFLVGNRRTVGGFALLALIGGFVYRRQIRGQGRNYWRWLASRFRGNGDSAAPTRS